MTRDRSIRDISILSRQFLLKYHRLLQANCYNKKEVARSVEYLVPFLIFTLIFCLRNG